MTRHQMTKAALLETMSRLAESLHALRAAGATRVGALEIANQRMIAVDEKAYLAAVADYRSLTHPHASIPAGCRLY